MLILKFNFFKSSELILNSSSESVEETAADLQYTGNKNIKMDAWNYMFGMNELAEV